MANIVSLKDISKIDKHEVQNLLLQRDSVQERLDTLTADFTAMKAEFEASKSINLIAGTERDAAKDECTRVMNQYTGDLAALDAEHVKEHEKLKAEHNAYLASLSQKWHEMEATVNLIPEYQQRAVNDAKELEVHAADKRLLESKIKQLSDGLAEVSKFSKELETRAVTAEKRIATMVGHPDVIKAQAEAAIADAVEIKKIADQAEAKAKAAKETLGRLERGKS